MKVILLNGPPRVGKDTLANNLLARLSAKGHQVQILRHADELKTSTHIKFALLDDNGKPFPPDHYEDRKDMSLDDFGGMTPRQAYIDHSENDIKPAFGKSYWAELLSDRMNLKTDMVYIVTDIGFEEEVAFYEGFLNEDETLLIRLYRDGFDFTNDSRMYVRSDVIPTCSITNGDPETFAATAETLISLHFATHVS